MCWTSSNSGSAAADARQEEERRQGRIKEGRTAIDDRFKGFDPNFYAGRRNDFIAHGEPQLQTHFKNAARAIQTNLARRGLLQSSAAARSLGDLTRQRAIAEGNLSGAADDYVSTLKGDVEQQKQNLFGLLTSSADPSAAAQNAQNASAALASRPAFQPLGNIFANLSSLAAANSNSVSAGNPSVFSRQPRVGGIGSKLKIVN